MAYSAGFLRAESVTALLNNRIRHHMSIVMALEGNIKGALPPEPVVV